MCILVNCAVTCDCDTSLEDWRVESHFIQKHIVSKQVFQIQQIYRPFSFWYGHRKFLFPSLKDMFLRGFLKKKKKIPGGMSQYRDLVKSIFCRFFNGKMPKISKIDQFQWSFVAKGCVLQEKVIKQKIFKIAFPTIYTAVLVALKCLLQPQIANF